MKTINDLRAVLFETIKDVRSGELDVSKAKAVTDLAQTMVNTAKVEVDFIRATDADVDSGFISEPKQLSGGVTGITRHRIR